MQKRRIGLSLGLICSLAFLMASPAAEARDLEDCMLKWHRAVASYLTQNRTSYGQDENMGQFESACQIEQRGDKKAARIDAVMVGVRALMKLDPRGCQRFMEFYVGATDPEAACNAAQEPNEKLRKVIEDSIPAKH
jgi:hypothetical protein